MGKRPECPQPYVPFPQYWDTDPPPKRRGLSTPSADEFRCLNLSLTVPRDALEDGGENRTSRVPVLVFIHGGGFAGGSHTVRCGDRLLFDPTDLVSTSVELKTPIIVVAINYRLGPFGFLASSELFTFNDEHKEPRGNYGLRDQTRALEWVSLFAAGFGGDPENVTVHGTSAGSIAIQYHLANRATKSLFRRAILCSGSLLSLPPRPVVRSQAQFDAYVQGLGIQAKNAELVAKLQTIPGDELLKGLRHLALAAAVFTPTIDDETVTQDSVTELLTTSTRNIMIGACIDEVSSTGVVSLPRTNHPVSSTKSSRSFLGLKPTTWTRRPTRTISTLSSWS